jgi:hypothetical protein
MNIMTAMEKAKPTRPDMRGAMTNEEDPRARAARRAAEVRGHLGSMDDGTDIFALPPAPSGWSYEWKRKSVLGQEDPAHQVALRRMGWDPVPSARHPEMMPSDNVSNTIERKGMILMERPTELVEEARTIELQRARQQVNHKEAQLAGVPEGGLGNRDHPQVKPRIGKSYEAMPIPKE